MSKPWRNLGPVSRQMLADAGIVTFAQLAQHGAVASYLLVKQGHPQATLNLLWALQGALDDLSWQQVAREQRLSLLLQLEQHVPPDG